MRLRDFDPDDLNSVYEILIANGWGHRVESAECLQQLVRASHRTAVASVGGQIAGFAHAITDGLSNGDLSMVVVAKPWRRQGVGRALVQHTIGEDQSITWVLRAGRTGAPDFFAKLGFLASVDAMELRHR
ncbi:MAG: GNAT family N-acetyltransferase [Proteobacteria bacterium]|nr:GNAT family N-acetyltransferase [Pseudomonadota bacterium]